MNLINFILYHQYNKRIVDNKVHLIENKKTVTQ